MLFLLKFLFGEKKNGFHANNCFIILNVSRASNHSRMTAEGSCDTEVWSYDAENSAF